MRWHARHHDLSLSTVARYSLLQQPLIVRKLIGKGAQAAEPVKVILLCLHRQIVDHAMPVLRPGAHIERNEMQAVLEPPPALSELAHQHVAIDAGIMAEGGGLDLLEPRYEGALVLIPLLKCRKTVICPLSVARAVAILEPSFGILL